MNSFNPAGFVEHVEKPLKRYIVRSKDDPQNGELIKNEQIDENCTEIVEDCEKLEEINSEEPQNEA